MFNFVPQTRLFPAWGASVVRKPAPLKSTLILGCGYLGIRVAQRLIARGEMVFGTTRDPDRIPELRQLGIEPIVANVLDPTTMDRLPSVSRLLYCVGFDRTQGVPIRDIYVDGLRHAAERLHHRVGRIVYTSSTGVYGDRGGQVVDEQSPTQPITESGLACLEAERVLLALGEQFAWPVCILRLAGLYGPGRIMRRQSLEAGEPIAASPEGYLNLIHIDDAATATIRALDGDEEGEVYLASDDTPVQRGEFYRYAAELLGAPTPRFEAHAQTSGRPPRGGQLGKRVDNRRLREELQGVLAYPSYRQGLPAALEVDRAIYPPVAS